MKFRWQKFSFRDRRKHARVLFEACEPRQLLAGGTIRGVAWNDLNDNAARDAGEPVLGGWTIYLDANHNAKLDAGETSTVTAADGSYAFTGLAAGNYLIGEVPKPGWQQTYPTVPAAAAAPALAVDSGSDVVTAAIRRSADLSGYTAAELSGVRQWVVAPSGQTTMTTIVSRTGAVGATPTGLLPGTYVLQFPDDVSGARAAARLKRAAGLSWFYPLVARQQQGRSAVPNDPLFPDQWHLNNADTPGADLDVLPAWDLAQGAGVTVAVVDDGVQYTHPDLAANYDAADSYDFNDSDSNPAPVVSNWDFHGTHVAGVLAARSNNGIGVSGVAPQAKFAALRLSADFTTDSQEAGALAYHRDAIAIYSNSWGPDDDGAHLEGPGPQTLAAIGQSVVSGRGGLGNVYVWAAGNGLPENDNVNYDGYANSRYVIAATALNDFGRQAFYAEPGAPIFVSAFGGDDYPGITTTDLTGSNGDNNRSGSAGDYFDNFGGTSSAAPMVSGVVALMLQANPNLTWRDVKHILADTAVKNDPTDPGWVRNGAGHWVNHKYGFGQVDAAAAVGAAIGWTNVAPETTVTSGTVAVNQAIPDNGPGTGVTSSFYVASPLRVETVEVVLNATIPRRGDLRVVLTSPDGTQSILAEPHDDDHANYASWTFSSTHHWDEIAQGTWTLRVTDERGANLGQFTSWKLNLYGTPVSGQHYVALAAGATVSGRDFGTRPLAGARVASASFPSQGGPQRLVFRFDQGVAGSISADDVEVYNQTTGKVVAAGVLNLSYDAATRTATWTFPGLARGILPDGDYTARLKAPQITLADGSMLDGNGDGVGGDDFALAFSFLQGDANHDRVVDSADVTVLLSNLKKTNVPWEQGDFNYDGTVGFTDYQIMELAYRNSLPAPAAPVAQATPVAVGVRATTRTVVARAVAVRPMAVVVPVFSTQPLDRRRVDLLDSLPAVL